MIQFIRLDWSSLAEGPATIAYRSHGTGPALVFLHGGWGYEVYPFGAQIAGLQDRFRIIVPDRSGHGRSTPVERLGPDFHHRAMLETVALLDRLDIGDAVWWGHSDGAVIAALGGIHRPDRCRAVVLEALHFSGAKPRSRLFFEQMAHRPDSFGQSLIARLAADHGEDRWRTVLHLDGAAWLALATRHDECTDLYDGLLGQLSHPALLIQGGNDPRAEPGEWEAVRACLPYATTAFYPSAGHSPHSEAATAALVTAVAVAFLTGQ